MNTWNRFVDLLWDLALWAIPILLVAIGGLVRKVMTNEAVIKQDREARQKEMEALQDSLRARDARDLQERAEQRERLTRIETRQDETYRIIIEHLASGKRN